MIFNSTSNLIQMKKIKTYLLISILFSACTLPQIALDQIDSVSPNDETVIDAVNFSSFDFENFIRENYPDYKIHTKNDSEVIFYGFLDEAENNGITQVYKLETYTLRKVDETKLHCSIKNFTCLNKNLNRLRPIHEGNSITHLRKKIIAWKKKQEE